MDLKTKYVPVADPGFPVGGCANPPGEGVLICNFAKIFKKLHEIEKIWALGRVRAHRSHRSANVFSKKIILKILTVHV